LPNPTLFPYTTLFRSPKLINFFHGGHAAPLPYSIAQPARWGGITDAVNFQFMPPPPPPFSPHPSDPSPPPVSATSPWRPEESPRSEEHTSELQSLRHL